MATTANRKNRALKEAMTKTQMVRKPATKARKMISPFTGQEITVAAKPASRTVKVQPLSGLKRMTE